MGITGAHFSEAELACKGTTCGPSGTGCHVNGCSQGLVDALEAFRAKVATAWAAKFQKQESEFPGVRVSDAFRCLKHNAGTTGAAADSQHPNGRAADIAADGMTAAELEAIALTIPEIRGIGRDDKRNFIHVDVRPTLTLARWCYYTDERGKTRWGAYYAPTQVA
jgi:hypothetical protein